MAKSGLVTRRSFLGAAATGAVLAGRGLVQPRSQLEAAEAQPAPLADVAEGRAGPVIDCHAHLAYHGAGDWREQDRQLIDAADRLGIDQLCCSILTPRKPSSLEGNRDCNSWLAEAMQRF